MVKKQHEIYFSDFKKVVPSKLRTVFRQSVTPKYGYHQQNEKGL